MKLKHTREWIAKELEEKNLDTYAIFVHKNGNEAFLHSENVDEDTYFDIASLGKILITTPLILQAVTEKKLSLEDTLDQFFENVPEDKKNITIKQLLTHTSGIIRIPLSPEAAAQGHDALAAQMIGHPLAFKPGTDYIYSCNGMILLGYILEKIYGEPLETLYETRLKKPLGQTRSRFNIAVGEPNAAISYSSDITGLSSPWDDLNVRVMKTTAGSGGQFFTLHDIKQYADAVMAKSEKLYAKELFDLAEQDYTEKTFLEGRGLGWFYVDERYSETGKLFPEGSFGHIGSTGTSIYFNRKEDLYVIILTNANRCLSLKTGYRVPMATIREEAHNAIYEDLLEEKLMESRDSAK